MPTRPVLLIVTDDTLICSSLPGLPTEKADAIREWLQDHGLDENDLPEYAPITRDVVQRTVSWSQTNRTGEPGHHWRAAPDDAPDVWPTPFPPALFEAPENTCPVCHQPWSATNTG